METEGEREDTGKNTRMEVSGTPPAGDRKIYLLLDSEHWDNFNRDNRPN